MRIIFTIQLFSILVFPLCVYAQSNPADEKSINQCEHPVPKGRVTRGYVPAEKPKKKSHTVTLPKGLISIPERKIVSTINQKK